MVISKDWAILESLNFFVVTNSCIFRDGNHSFMHELW